MTCIEHEQAGLDVPPSSWFFTDCRTGGGSGTVCGGYNDITITTTRREAILPCKNNINSPDIIPDCVRVSQMGGFPKSE